jgi:hypothetical protein
MMRFISFATRSVISVLMRSAFNGQKAIYKYNSYDTKFTPYSPANKPIYPIWLFLHWIDHKHALLRADGFHGKEINK